MLREDSELLTKVGPGTPMGALMRRYWIPALFSRQIAEPDCPPVRVKLLGERLVAFRDSDGRIGLLSEACPHRTASLFFGRNEQCGLRCVYHGWKFDVEGRCVDMPGEPPGSDFKNRIRTNAYPCEEHGDIVWAYMGAPESKPAFPEMEWALVPDSHRYVTRHIQECNWLQALEGGFDPLHLWVLHKNDGASLATPRRWDQDVAPTDFGLIVGSPRALDDGDVMWATSVMMLPFFKLIPPGFGPFGGHAWVPIDDESTMNYSFEYHPERPLQHEEMQWSYDHLYIHAETLPGTDRAALNKDNDYLIDREAQRSGKSFTGIKGFCMQDCAIQESMGRIADRAKEHLALSDGVIVKLRRFLLQAVRDLQSGRPRVVADARSYRIRATHFRSPADEPFQDGVRRTMLGEPPLSAAAAGSAAELRPAP
jgi:phthalate 4,5-dioxygenase